MTKPREKTCEELQTEIEDGKKKIRQYENREKMLRQKLSKEEAAALLRLALTSQPARKFLRKRAEEVTS